MACWVEVIREEENRLRETYAEIRREHACSDDEVGEDEAGHSKGEEDWFAIIYTLLALSFRSLILLQLTRMKRAINHFLRPPQIRVHFFDITLLVSRDELFRLLQPGRGDEERAGEDWSICVHYHDG